MDRSCLLEKNFFDKVLVLFLASFFQRAHNVRVAGAKHNTYAYRIKSPDGYVEHYEDNGEYGAGSMLLDLLKDENVDNKLVCVTRWYGGTHLGRARFDHIINTAKASLDKLD